MRPGIGLADQSSFPERRWTSLNAWVELTNPALL
jgi:hypothetical protein